MAAPAGQDTTVAVSAGASYTLTLADFGLAGAAGSEIHGVVLFPVWLRGRFEINGVPQSSDILVTRAQVEAGALRYTPPAVAGFDTLPFSLLDTRNAVDLTANLVVFEVGAGNTAAPQAASGDGLLRIDLPGGREYGRRLALRPDGTISVLLSDTEGADFGFARLLPSGQFDPVFGSGAGPLSFGTGAGANSGRDMALLSNGRSLVVEWGTPGTGIEVTRLTAAGRLDPSFAGDGQAEVNLSGVQNERGRALLPQGDGSVIVVFNAGGNASLMRLDAGGALDRSFGVSGVARGPAGTPFKALQHPDGKIVLVMASSEGSVLARVHADGSSDPSFGSGGQVPVALGTMGSLSSVALQPDGKILAVGWSGDSTQAFTALRYNVDGAPDATFGSGGRFVLAGAASIGYGAALLPDGGIVAVGSGSGGAVVLRLDALGRLDGSFGNGGVVRVAAGGGSGVDVAIAADGTILVSGGVTDDAGRAALLFALRANGSVDPDFAARRYTSGSDPVVIDPDMHFFDAELAARGSRTQSTTLSSTSWGSGADSGRVEIPLLTALGSYAGATLALAREGASDPSDVFSGSGALVLAGGTVTLGGVALGTYTAGAGTLSLTFGEAATSARVTEALRSIAYRNTSTEPPISVRIAWTVADGSPAAAGTLSASAVSTIHIVAPGATASADRLAGTSAANRLEGGAGNDVIDGRGGNDVVDGGTGVDTFVLDVSLADVLARPAALRFSPGWLAEIGSSVGTVELAGIERLRLRDGLFAFDTLAPLDDLPGGKVWQAAALYRAAFGQLPGVADLSRWTAQGDRSSDMAELARAMLAHYAPGASTSALVQHLYFMLTGATPSAQTTQSIVDLVGPGRTFQTQGELFAHAATSAPNTAHLVEFTGTVQVLDPGWFGG